MRQKSRKHHEVHFMLTNYSWPWGLPWSVINIPNETLLEKKLIFPLETVTDSFWVSGGSPYLFPPLSAGTLPWTFVGLVCAAVLSPHWSSFLQAMVINTKLCNLAMCRAWECSVLSRRDSAFRYGSPFHHHPSKIGDSIIF